jgi:hypothetical protein
LHVYQRKLADCRTKYANQIEMFDVKASLPTWPPPVGNTNGFRGLSCKRTPALFSCRWLVQHLMAGGKLLLDLLAWGSSDYASIFCRCCYAMPAGDSI